MEPLAKSHSLAHMPQKGDELFNYQHYLPIKDPIKYRIARELAENTR